MAKLGGLQLLRAFAAIMVLIGHSIAEAEHYFSLSFQLGFIPWTRGVDLFFVISGFIIALSATRYLRRPLAFIKRRIMRVVPLYYFFTTLMVITIYVFPNGLKETVFDLGQIVSSYGFFPYARGDGRIAPVLSLGWTLNYEMFFYALCALSLTFRHAMLVLCFAIIFIVFSGWVFDFPSAPWAFWSNSILIEFIFGIWLAKAYQSGWLFPSRPIATGVFLMAVALFILMAPAEYPRFITAGIPATLMVAAGTIFCPPLFIRSQILGDSSYALYLSHRFTMRAGTILLLPVLPNSILGAWGYLISICVSSIFVGLLVYIWFEKPFLTPNPKQVFT